jgi:hypothetical protein
MTSLTYNNFKLELASDGLSFPTSITFDKDGIAYVTESGVPFIGQAPIGRIWRIFPDNRRSILIDDLRGPVNGITFHDGKLYVSEGGYNGSICTVDISGEKSVLINGLPGPGNYHTNMTAIGPDKKLYFSQGAMTNTAIVGLDAYELGWLRRLPHAHDIPGFDIVLAGVNMETANPFDNDKKSRSKTGAFVPFGAQTKYGQQIPAGFPCTASISQKHFRILYQQTVAT